MSMIPLLAGHGTSMVGPSFWVVSTSLEDPVHISSGTPLSPSPSTLASAAVTAPSALLTSHITHLRGAWHNFLWFGWFGFNGGSALAASLKAIQACIVTNLAASVGGLTWMFWDYRLEKKWSAVGFCSGAISGLVAITPASGFVGARKFSCVTQIIGIFAAHGVGGIVGNLLTALFAQSSVAAFDGLEIPGGWIDHHYIQLGYQLADSVAGFAYAFGMTTIILWIMHFIPYLRIRVDEETEILGIDDAEMGEFAYDYVGLESEIGHSPKAEVGATGGAGNPTTTLSMRPALMEANQRSINYFLFHRPIFYNIKYYYSHDIPFCRMPLLRNTISYPIAAITSVTNTIASILLIYQLRVQTQFGARLLFPSASLLLQLYPSKIVDVRYQSATIVRDALFIVMSITILRAFVLIRIPTPVSSCVANAMPYSPNDDMFVRLDYLPNVTTELYYQVIVVKTMSHVPPPPTSGAHTEVNKISLMLRDQRVQPQARSNSPLMISAIWVVVYLALYYRLRLSTSNWPGGTHTPRVLF
ncbi:ammonium transporter [Salix suchowensis]|nr:ammonium transporter [Salix suchowensis]